MQELKTPEVPQLVFSLTSKENAIFSLNKGTIIYDKKE